MELKKFKSTLSNLSYALLAQSISLILSLIMSLIVPKLLNVEEYGYFQLFIFYSTYVGLFHFGMTDGIYLKYGGMRYQDLNKSLLGSQLWLMVLFQSAISLFIFLYAVNYVEDTKRIFVVFSLIVYIVVANITWFFGFIFQAVNHTKWYSISVIISKASYIFFIISLIFLKESNYKIYIVLFIVAQGLAGLYCIFLGRDIAFAKLVSFKESLTAFFSNVKVGINLLFANVASMMILGSGRIVVDYAWGVSAFGKFSFAISLSGFFLQFINQLSMVLFPALRRADEGELKDFYKISRTALFIFLPFIYLVYTPIESILSLWLPQYKESLIYMALLLPICTFDSKMNLLCITYFKVLRKEKVLLFVNILTMIISFLLSIISAFFIKNIYAVVISMVIAIAFRSIISEIYLAKIMQEKIASSIIQDLLLSLAFLYSTLQFDHFKGFTVFLVMYVIFVLFNWKKISALFGKSPDFEA